MLILLYGAMALGAMTLDNIQDNVIVMLMVEYDMKGYMSSMQELKF